jgi:hypothetical protein
VNQIAVLSRRLLILPACSSLAIMLVVVHGATAQSATGTITGRVLWGPCLRGIPLPMAPDAQGQSQPVAPDASMQPQPGMPQPVPVPANGLPAGAVLVAVQSTAVNARTDEAGRFSLSGVPAGQYLTVAAGPVANASMAIAERPNVFVSGGQSVDIGTLNLGGTPSPFGIACRILPGVGAAQGADTTSPQPAPPPDNTPEGGSTNP